MRELTLAMLAIFILLFLRNPQWSESITYPVELRNLPKLTNVNVSCCSKLMKFFNEVKDKLPLQCEIWFWAGTCYIEIRAADITLPQLEVSKYKIESIKSLKQLKFRYTRTQTGKKWKLIVNTANSSTANQIGRVYFKTKCSDPPKTFIPLANNLNNFEPGKTDMFEFEAPEFKEANYCVLLMTSLSENWIVSSFILIDHNKINYSFYHGERTTYHKFYGYRSTSNSVNWTFTVTTGSIGTTRSVDITLINGQCNTKLTLDSKDDDFQPNSTDVFHMQAKDCKGLEKIEIESQENNPSWIFIQLNATDEAGQSYVFYHNETLKTMQTFYVNQSTGDNKWDVSVCSNTSTDSEVYLSLYDRQGSTKHLRLSTPEDDFKAGQCSNFTLFLRNLGKLWKIKIEKPKEFQISRLTLSTKGDKYEFYPPISQEKNLQLVYPKMGVSTFQPDSNTAGQTVKDCAVLCLNDERCQHFSVDKKNCNFDPPRNTSIVYIFKSEITAWTVNIWFTIQVTQFRISLVGPDNTLIIITSSAQEKYISTTFSKLSTYFNFPTIMRLTTSPKISCKNVQIQLKKLTAFHLTTVGLTIDNICSWKCHAERTDTRGTKRTTSTTRKASITTTPAKYTNNADSKPYTTLITYPNKDPNNDTTLIPHLNTDLNNDTTMIPHPNTDSNNNTTQKTYANSSDILTASNSTVQTTDLPNVTMDAKLCRCVCPRNLSEEQQAELLKSLTKELKVNRNETSSYKRSKISAPDDRVSSQVIGTAAVAIMVVPFALIVLIDLIPLLSLIYKKLISFV